jgi:hypothetical protein
MRVPATAIQAAELASLLPSLFLVDLSPLARFRYCGIQMATRYGRDLTGESFLGIWTPEDQLILARDLRTIAQRPCGLVAGVMAETIGGFISFEMLLLPLGRASDAAGALGSMVRIGGHEERNRIRARVVTQWLRSTRFLAGGADPAMQDTPPPAPASSGAGASRRYGHLTVVSGGK